MISRALTALVCAILIALPSVASACPACVGSQKSWSTSLKLVGILILTPFFVFAVVVYAIRRATAAARE